jgi:hypothetical protein
MSEPRTVRVYWGRFKGRVNLNFNWDAIQPGSVVHVTACESAPRPSHDPIFADEPMPTDWVTGGANVTVHGVSPHKNPDGVGFILTVDWDSPLPIVTDITVFDRPEIVDIGNLVYA